MRPINPDGTWGQKQRREYVLDDEGNRVLDRNGKPMFNAVPTTDWGSPETLEEWREAWCRMVNEKFAKKGLDVRIDHRSYVRQGIDLIPTCLLYTSRVLAKYEAYRFHLPLQRKFSVSYQ